MTFVKGDPRINRSGRPPGVDVAGVRVSKAADQLKADLRESGRLTPLEFLLSEMDNAKNKLPVRLRCAEAALPYLHRKMPVGIDNGRGGPVQLVAVQALAQLPIEQLLQMETILSHVGALTDALPHEPEPE